MDKSEDTRVLTEAEVLPEDAEVLPEEAGPSHSQPGPSHSQPEPFHSQPGPSHSRDPEVSSGATCAALFVTEDTTYRPEGTSLIGRQPVVVYQDLVQLLEHFMRSPFDASTSDDNFSMGVQKKCEELFRKDYKCSLLRNTSGIIAKSYPYNIIYLDRELTEEEKENSAIPEQGIMSTEAADVFVAITEGHNARRKKRFPVPVMLYKNQFVCRSAGLATGKEIQLRQSDTEVDCPTDSDGTTDSSSGGDDEQLLPKKSPSKKLRWTTVAEASAHDIGLLRKYNTCYICDLMLEKKNARFYIRTAARKNLWYTKYTQFCILHAPYPDYKFFEKFSEKGTGIDLYYKWSAVNSSLILPDGDVFNIGGINWYKYKNWDLLTLSLNYVKMLLSAICSGNGALLIQCLLGVDRTPLFVSLIRLSLWADGMMHKSLLPIEMAYLVIAYDWYLFGHDLPERIGNAHEVMNFFFNILTFLEAESFCVHNCVKKWKEDLSAPITKDVESRKEVLTDGQRQNKEFDLHFRLAERFQYKQAIAGPPYKIPHKLENKSSEIVCQEFMEFSRKSNKQMSYEDLQDSIRPCKCSTSSDHPVNSPVNVMLWRQEKLKSAQANLTSAFALAACSILYASESAPPQSAPDLNLKAKEEAFVANIRKLTPFRFLIEDLCPTYRRLKQVMESKK